MRKQAARAGFTPARATWGGARRARGGASRSVPPRIASWISRAALSAAVLAQALPAGAGLILTEKAALERAFPGRQPERRTLYLTKPQVAAVEKAARSRLPSPLVTVFDAGPAGRAYLDTHVVRTMPETVMTVVEPDGRLKMALVLQFNEPGDYLPRPPWLKTLEGKSLDGELWPGRGVRRVTGATLTVQALTAAVRRSLAIDAVVMRGTP